MTWVPLTNVVVSAVPFNDTTPPETKPVPFTVNVNAEPAAVTFAGEMLVMTGAGAVIAKVTALEAVPDGLVNVIFADPGCAVSVAGTAAVTSVPLTNVVVSGVLFNATTAPETKPVPLTVRVNAAPPATTDAGEILVITGPDAAMVNVSAFETRLPLLTVTVAEPVCAIRPAGTSAVN